MKRKLYEVWKDGFDPKKLWSLQMPKGILGFRTKKLAKAFGEVMLLTANRKES